MLLQIVILIVGDTGWKARPVITIFFIVNPNGDVSTNLTTQLEYNDRANFFSALNMNPEYEFDIVYS